MGTITSLELARGERPAAQPPDRVLAAGLLTLAAVAYLPLPRRRAP